jgi:hypothetical protein
MYLHMCGSVWGNGLLATRVPSGPGREAFAKDNWVPSVDASTR